MRRLLLLPVVLLVACVTEGPPRVAPDPEPVTAAALNVQLGFEYLRGGKRAEAVQKFSKALEQDPDNAQAHLGLAFVHEQAGDLRTARGHYRDAVTRAKRDPAILTAWGTFLCRQREFAAAEGAFVEAARTVTYRTPELAWTSAGVCAAQAGDQAKAEDYLREALKYNPRHGEALFQLAEISHGQGEHLRARAFLERYLADHPVTPGVLLLAWRTERALNDSAAAGRFAARLRKEFPASAEARQVGGQD